MCDMADMSYDLDCATGNHPSNFKPNNLVHAGDVAVLSFGPKKIVIAAVQSWKCLSFELSAVSLYASLSAMKSNFPKTAQLDDDEWERMSSYSLAKSCNTGFSKGYC